MMGTVWEMKHWLRLKCAQWDESELYCCRQLMGMNSIRFVIKNEIKSYFTCCIRYLFICYTVCLFNEEGTLYINVSSSTDL